MKIKKIGILAIIFLLSYFSLGAEEYKKATQAYLSVPELNTNEISAINCILNGEDIEIKVEGAEGSSETTIFSGKNHHLDGRVYEGGKPAFRLNVSQDYLTTEDVTLEGIPTAIEDNFHYSLNTNTLASFLRKNADITITTETTLENTTIGTQNDYKIVYSENAPLTLSTNFTGYGILYLTDENYSEDEAILKMLANAKWYGLIIINQIGETPKKSRILLNGTTSGSGIGNFVLLGIKNAIIGNNLKIKSGSMGINSILGSAIIGNNAEFSNSLYGNILVIGNNCEIDENIYYNFLLHGANFKLDGEAVTPYSFPFIELPSFPEFDVGTQNITKGHNQTLYLEAGSYKNITFGNNCTLYLIGGEYRINKLVMGNNPKIKYLAPSTIMIKKKITLKNNADIEPATEDLDARDCIFYIQGSNLHSLTKVFYTENNSKLYCNIYVPNNKVAFGNNLKFTGAVISKYIHIGNNAKLSLKNAFSPTITEGVKIYGGLILIGNKFYIPNQGSNVKVYYCEEALNQVNQELNSRPFIFKEWKEIE